MLGKLLGRLDRDALPPASWLREGWPRAIPLVLVCILPLLVAGPIRALTGMSLGPAFAVALGLVALAAWPFRRALARVGAPRVRAVAANGIALALAATAAWLVFNRDFAGLYGYQDAQGHVAIDAAAHVLFGHRFAHGDPGVYSGFVSLYAFWNGILGVLHWPWPGLGPGDRFVVAANLSFQLEVIVVAAVPCAVAFAVLRNFRRGAFAAGALACLGAGLAVSTLLVLPLQAFHFAGGFWPHLFALLPLVGIWLADALVRSPALRMAAVLALVALYRYTYGLNLPDLLGAAGVLLAIEAAGRGFTRAARIGALLLAAAAFVASRHAFALLVPIVTGSHGWIVPHDRGVVLSGELLGAAALAAAMAFVPARVQVRGSGIVRALRFPALFAVASAVATWLYRAQPGGRRAYATQWDDYYFQKLDLHAVILLGGAVVVLAAFCAAAVAARPSWRTAVAAGLALLLALASQRALQRGVAPYREALREAALGRPPYARLRPWVDVDALGFIQRRLARRAARFGGYVAQPYPMAAFTSAIVGRGALPFWRPQPVDTSAGHCVFWQAGTAPALDGAADKSCESYRPRWAVKGTRRTICGACYGPGIRTPTGRR